MMSLKRLLPFMLLWGSRESILIADDQWIYGCGEINDVIMNSSSSR